MPLGLANVGDANIIKKISGQDDVRQHLAEMGFVVGAEVTVISELGGNLILNVGPDATGRFPAQSCRLLDEIGAWMALNSESIYGCGSAELPKPDWGWYTRRAGKLYAHVLEAPLGPLPLTGLVPAHIGAVRRLADGGEVVRGESWVTSAYENLAFVSFGTVPQYTYPLPDPIDTVLEIEYQ